ncbi:MAG: RrF2 family transcriptional regulator [Chloroflexota bacterium]
MRMSEGVEWALHGVTLLAALPAGATLPGKALAEFHGVSESYLLKHLQSLTAAGILESVPGPKGGYRLARPAHEVTVLDVVVAVEGPQPAFRCTEIRQRGPTAVESASYQTPCGINALMLRAEAAWQQVLRSQTVADLLVVAMEGIGRRRAEKAAGWLQQNARS